MKENEFINELTKLNINLTREQLEQLKTYANFLLSYNEHTNLTAIKTLDEVYLKHFYDSLTLSKVTNFTNESLLDIGTGAGFPGLVLAIVYPNLQVTLLDSNNKKIKFLKECISKLNLKNVTLVEERAEDYARYNREKFDYLTSRAVAELRILLELGIPALKVNGHFLIMKANISEEEQNNSLGSLKELSSSIISTEEFTLPNNAGHRTILDIQKKSITDSKYPRSYDKIKKKILK